MRLLVACEYCGVVREAFRRKGWDAWSCDLLETEIPGPHYKGDVRDMLSQSWDMMIAHPPCTYLSNSGVCWLHKQPGRWESMRQGAEFFKMLLEVDIARVCLENPVMHKYAKEIIGAWQSQCVQPWMFGHMEQKATCLWLRDLPLLKPTKDVKQEMLLLPDNQRQRLHYLPPSEQRARFRSKTFQGIADAMAEQWGNL